MRNLKKFLALVMAMVMTLSLMVTVNAATSNVVYSDSASVTPAFAEAVDVLSGMGVFKGDEDGFRPASTITRAEVAAIVYRLSTGDVTDSRAGLYKTYAPFTDVNESDWFAGYVGYLWNAGYIKGTTATTYNPYDNVTGYEALAMILRAVGYDKNHEFEGGQWIVNVASYATQLGILRDVKTTHFGDTLHLGARRDVVASLLFNTAAYVPQVTYTQLAGYNQYKNITSNEFNDTLGKRLFGLTSDRGIVVGNQATGEKYTKIGFSVNGNREFVNPNFSICQFANKPDADAYIYETDNGDNTTSNVTLSFIWDTDLKMFGHKVKVWYDYRTTNNTYENYYREWLNGDGVVVDSEGRQYENTLNTYAMYDEVSKTAVAKIEAANLDFNPADDNLRDVDGFDAKATDTAYFNYAFAPTTGADLLNETSGKANFKSPIMKNNGTPAKDTDPADETAPYYLLISNSTTRDNSIDLVVSLDLAVTQISQQNDVQKPLSIGLNVGDGNEYFGGGYDDGAANENELFQIGGVTPFGKRTSIAQKNLVLDSAKTLGDNVVAIEITGTTDNNPGGNTFGPSRLGNAKAEIGDKDNTSNYYYQTIKLDRTLTGTVVKVDTDNHNVWLADGTKLERSWLADTVANNRLTTLAATNDAAGNKTKNVERTIEPKDFDEYVFTLDEEGKYIFWSAEKTAEKFVYGTFIDYDTVTASSSFVYPLVYVGMDGKQGMDNVTKITNATEPDPIDDGAKLNSATYEASELPKRDKFNDKMGAQVYDGRYIGYTLNDKGELEAVLANANPTNTVKQGDDDFFGGAAIAIESDDVKIGAISAGTNDDGNTGLYLTNNTVFYLVSGAGTDNQKIQTYKGLSGLMEGMKKVTIHGNKTVAETAAEKDADEDSYWPLAAGTENKDMIYWTQSSFHYAQDYATTAWQADVVFLPAEAVEFEASTSSNTFFVGDTGSTVVDHKRDATLFTMYDASGNERAMWVEGVAGAGDLGNSADIITTLGANNAPAAGNIFVKLVATDDKAADGQPIYEVRGWDDAPESSVIGKVLNADRDGLIDCNDETGVTHPYGYIATTYSYQLATIGANDPGTAGGRTQIWNVADAKVINLDKDCWPGITDLTTLNAASTLEQNKSITVSCFLSSSNSKQASVIFVNWDAND